MGRNAFLFQFKMKMQMRVVILVLYLTQRVTELQKAILTLERNLEIQIQLTETLMH